MIKKSLSKFDKLKLKIISYFVIVREQKKTFRESSDLSKLWENVCVGFFGAGYPNKKKGCYGSKKVTDV